MKFFLAILLTTLPIIVNAGTATNVLNSKVVKLSFPKTLGNMVLIKLERLQEDKIDCHINGTWNYSLPIQSDMDKAMVSALIAAYISGSNVNIYGSGSCDEFPSIESAATVRLDNK